MPSAQRSLFDGPDAAHLVCIEGVSRALSRNQRLFNRLTKRVRELRAELAAWQHSVDHYRQRVAGEIEPLQRELCAEQRAAVLFMDALLSSNGKVDRLTRPRRAKLQGLLVTLAEPVLQAGPDEEVEAVLDRYIGSPKQDRRGIEFGLAEAVLGELFGDDTVAGHSATNIDDLLAHAGERLHARFEAEAEERRQRSERSGKHRNGPAVTQERLASQSVRDVFRRLAGALHPDREPDATQRARKTALMQRVNQAYERDDLLELLTVQMEIEQIDSSHLAEASEKRLGHYCVVLREQERTLQSELADIQAPVFAAFDIGPQGHGLQPEALDMLIERDLQGLREVLANLRDDMGGMRDPRRRGAILDELEFEDEEDNAIEEMLLAAALARAPVGRRRKKTKGRRSGRRKSSRAST
jgi:hypothetical protein